MLIFSRETNKRMCLFFALLVLLLMSLNREVLAVVAPDEWRVYGPTNNVGNAWNEPPTTSFQRCVKIPQNMKFCYGIGYEYMRLPNMLHHETEQEASSQLEHWSMLKRTNCHSELPIFLCSMYAPVCVSEFPEKEIRPCRSLCEAVKRECLPLMRRYGYDWPDIANCNQFPEKEDPMCIRDQKVDLNCKACKKADELTMEFIGSSFCLNSLVFKTGIVNIREIRTSNGGVERVVQFKKLRPKAFFRTEGVNGLPRVPFKIGRLRDDSSSKCNCSHLDGPINRKGQFLIMGNLNHATGELDINFIHKWVRDQSEFRKGIRRIRKSLRGRIHDICSNRIIPTMIGPRPSEDTQSAIPSRNLSNKKGRNATKKPRKPRNRNTQRSTERSSDRNGSERRNRINGGRKNQKNKGEDRKKQVGKKNRSKTSKLTSKDANSEQLQTVSDETVYGKGSGSEKMNQKSSKSPYYRFSQ